MAAPTRTIKLPKIGVVLQLPAAWSSTDKNLRFDASAPGNGARLTIETVTTGLSLAAIGASFVKSERKQLPQASVTSKYVRLPAGRAIEVTIRFPGLWNGRRTPVTHFVYSFKHGSRAYVVDWSAPDDWISNNRRTLAAAMASFGFLNNHAA